MRHRPNVLSVLLSAALWVALPPHAAGQSAAARLIQAARDQIEGNKLNQAAGLLNRALDPQMGATAAERTRAYILLGIARLPDSLPAASEAFRRALALDSTLKVDSLAYLDSRLMAVFDAERAGLLTLTLEGSPDTVVPTPLGRWQLLARTSHRSSLVLNIASEDGAVVHTDSQVAAGTVVLEWDLRTSNGGVVSPGRYVLFLAGRGPLGAESSRLQRLVLIDSVAPDTQPLPPALDQAALAPESASVSITRRPQFLLRGVLIGGVAGLLSSLGPGGRDHADAKSLVIGAATTLGGLIGFFSEHRVLRPIAANIEHNRALLQQDAQRREQIRQDNDRARATPRLRIRIEGIAK